MSRQEQPWLRWYTDVLHNPKVHRLGKHEFWTWTMMLAAYRANRDVMPSLADLAFLLRMPAATLERHIRTITDVGLFDVEDGDVTPHNWDERQFISDTSKARTAAYRDRHKKRHSDVTGDDVVTSQARHSDGGSDDVVTGQERARSDAEQIQNRTEPEQKRAPAALVLPDWLPPEVWCDFTNHRKRVKAPLHTRASELILAKLEDFRTKGLDPIAAINASIENGWKGVFEPLSQARTSNGTHAIDPRDSYPLLTGKHPE